jgi:DNA-binding NarL/FixJ family response regulator
LDQSAVPRQVTTFENDDYVYDAVRAGAAVSCSSAPGQPRCCTRSGWSPARTRCCSRPRSAGSPLPATRRPDAPPLRDRLAGSLTDREAEVLRLMATGLSNAEIATRLYVSAETVKTHVSNVLAKLGARDRTQVVIVAYESGFVDPAAPD